MAAAKRSAACGPPAPAAGGGFVPVPVAGVAGGGAGGALASASFSATTPFRYPAWGAQSLFGATVSSAPRALVRSPRAMYALPRAYCSEPLASEGGSCASFVNT